MDSSCFAILYGSVMSGAQKSSFNKEATSIGMKIQHPELSEYKDVKRQDLDDIFEQ